MTRPEEILDRIVRARFLVLVPDQKANRRAECFPLEDSAQDMDLIGFAPGGGDGALSGPSPIKLLLDVLFRYCQPGSYPVNQDPHRLAVAFTECRNSK